MFVFRLLLLFFFFNDTATTEIYTLSLHDALPISWSCAGQDRLVQRVIAPSRWTSAPQAGQWVGIRNSGRPSGGRASAMTRSEEHTSELQSRPHLVFRLLLEKKYLFGLFLCVLACR